MKRWVPGSTPNRVIERAATEGVPVIAYAGSTGLSGRFEDLLVPAYRHYRNVFRSDGSGQTEAT